MTDQLVYFNDRERLGYSAPRHPASSPLVHHVLSRTFPGVLWIEHDLVPVNIGLRNLKLGSWMSSNMLKDRIMKKKCGKH